MKIQKQISHREHRVHRENLVIRFVCAANFWAVLFFQFGNMKPIFIKCTNRKFHGDFSVNSVFSVAKKGLLQ